VQKRLAIAFGEKKTHKNIIINNLLIKRDESIYFAHLVVESSDVAGTVLDGELSGGCGRPASDAVPNPGTKVGRLRGAVLLQLQALNFFLLQRPRLVLGGRENAPHLFALKKNTIFSLFFEERAVFLF